MQTQSTAVNQRRNNCSFPCHDPRQSSQFACFVAIWFFRRGPDGEPCWTPVRRLACCLGSGQVLTCLCSIIHSPRLLKKLEKLLAVRRGGRGGVQLAQVTTCWRGKGNNFDYIWMYWGNTVVQVHEKFNPNILVRTSAISDSFPTLSFILVWIWIPFNRTFNPIISDFF